MRSRAVRRKGLNLIIISPKRRLPRKKTVRKIPIDSSLRCLLSLLLAKGLLLVSVLAGVALAAPAASDLPPSGSQIAANPQAAYTFIGWDQLGHMLGLSDKYGLSLGGYLIPEFNSIASGGVEPGSTFLNFALGLHASLDTEKAFSIPGGTFGIEFLEFTGGATNEAAGSVQLYTVMDGPAPRNRQELMQLWWRQRLFNDKLIFHIGKINGPGSFGNVQTPVTFGASRFTEGDITNLLFVPVGLNPTLFGRLPSYYNTGYGAVVHFAPTEKMYASYGLFDANGIRGVQTGIKNTPTFNSYKLHIGEIGYSWLLGDEELPGRVGVGVWGQTGELYTPSLTTENGAIGYYLFANHRLWYMHPHRDNAGIIGYFQFARTDANTQAVKTYVGAGLTSVHMIPGRPADQISIGMAWSSLNDMPGAGEFFYPGVESESTDLRDSEFMLQTVYFTTFFFKLGGGFWSLSPALAYTYIPNPGKRPDLPAAHAITLRLVTLF